MTGHPQARPLAELAARAPAGLVRACQVANRAAFGLLARRNVCVVASHALAAFLALQRYEPVLVRPEWHVFPADRRLPGASLSWDGDGTRRRAAVPGCWHGHLAVACAGFLLDPTIDQVNGAGIAVPPLVIPLGGWWDEGGWVEFTDEAGAYVRGCRYHRQRGWKSAPDARPSHWADVLHRMVDLWLARS